MSGAGSVKCVKFVKTFKAPGSYQYTMARDCLLILTTASYHVVINVTAAHKSCAEQGARKQYRAWRSFNY